MYTSVMTNIVKDFTDSSLNKELTKTPHINWSTIRKTKDDFR